jgi:sugar phosphate permease
MRSNIQHKLKLRNSNYAEDKTQSNPAQITEAEINLSLANVTFENIKPNKKYKESNPLSEEDDKSPFAKNQDENELNCKEIKFSYTKSQYIYKMFENMQFGLKHIYLLLSIFLIRTVEGTEILSLSITSKNIEHSFNLAANTSSIITLIILLGNLIGSIISILIDSKFNRKICISIGACITICFSFISLFSNTIIMFAICRHLANIGIGMIIPASTALVTESINMDYRGFMINLILISSNVGELFITGILNANYIQHPQGEGSHLWRTVFVVALLPVK